MQLRRQKLVFQSPFFTFGVDWLWFAFYSRNLYLAMIATRRELTSFNCYAYYDMIDALNCQLNFGLKSYYAPFNASVPFSLRHLDGYDYQLNI